MMKRFLLAVSVFGLLAAPACVGDAGDQNDDITNPDDDTNPDDVERDEWDDLLDSREVDYSAALRIAALRLTGEMPTLSEIQFVADASDQKKAYESVIAQYVEDPRLSRQLFSLFQDTFKMGSTPLLDSAAGFAMDVVVSDRPFTDVLTASSGTCGTYDPATSTYTAADCDNNVPAHAGLLTHPGMNAHFVSNMAFRRVRWVQETFACTAFPAEVTEPVDVGGAALYTAPWEFSSIAGYENGGEIDFLDTSAVVCANCHATMNHLAPLFGNFDEQGLYQPQIAVTKPTDGLPLTEYKDWLPEGETTAWRLGYPAPDLPALGAVMAADPLVAECVVARTWNWAFGKGDIVDTLSVVPSDVIAQQVADFSQNGYRLKQTIYDVFTHDDFVKF